MARRMAGTDSPFTIGMRAGADFGKILIQTGEVLKDRADQKKAEQVQLEYQKADAEIKAEWTEVQERARTLAKEYSDKGVDMPQEEARALQQEIRTKKAAYLTNKMDLAMTFMGQHPTNKYVQDQFKPLVDSTLTQLSVANQQAQMEHQRAVEEYQRGRDAIGDARYAQGISREDERNAESDRRFNVSEANRNARAADRGRTGPSLDVNEILDFGQMAEAEAARKPESFWQERARAEGLDWTPEAKANVMGTWTYERTLESLGAQGYTPEQLQAVPRPSVFTQPVDPTEERVKDLREAAAYWNAKDPQKYAGRVADINDALVKAEKALAEKRAQEAKTPEERKHEGTWNVVKANSWTGWLTTLQEAASEDYGPQRGPGKTAANEARFKGAKPPTGIDTGAEEAAGPEPEAAPAEGGVGTWNGKPLRRGDPKRKDARTGKPENKWSLYAGDERVPDAAQAQMLMDFHDRGETAPWMRE